jgi:hypothetical protein
LTIPIWGTIAVILRTKVSVAVTVDPDLLAWMKFFTKNVKRGVSGFVEDLCQKERRRLEGKAAK